MIILVRAGRAQLANDGCAIEPFSVSLGAVDSLVWLTMACAVASFLLTRWLILWQRKGGLGQPIRDYGPDIHQHKRGTPTMGGLSILIVLMLLGIGLALVGRLTPLVLFVLVSSLGFGAIGLLDDALKFWKKTSDGLIGRYKLLLQGAVSALLCAIAYSQGLFQIPLKMPFLSEGLSWPLVVCIGLAVCVLIGTVTAVNFNDGLDGLASGTTLITVGAFAIVSYLQGHNDLVSFLIVAMAVILGFFWWNVYPAHIFMGDTGSFTLGGLVRATTLATRSEFFLPLLAFIPMIEVVSVMIQVPTYKLTKKRVFKVAPLHHHFELAKGVNYEFNLPNIEWPEPLITFRFWIVAAFVALIGLLAYR